MIRPNVKQELPATSFKSLAEAMAALKRAENAATVKAARALREAGK